MRMMFQQSKILISSSFEALLEERAQWMVTVANISGPNYNEAEESHVWVKTDVDIQDII
jgi:hypothetical protein